MRLEFQGSQRKKENVAKELKKKQFSFNLRNFNYNKISVLAFTCKILNTLELARINCKYAIQSNLS